MLHRHNRPFRPSSAPEDGNRPNRYRIISDAIGYDLYKSTRKNILRTFDYADDGYNKLSGKTFFFMVRLKYRNKL